MQALTDEVRALPAGLVLLPEEEAELLSWRGGEAASLVCGVWLRVRYLEELGLAVPAPEGAGVRRYHAALSAAIQGRARPRPIVEHLPHWGESRATVFLGTDGGNFDNYGDPNTGAVYFLPVREGCRAGLFGDQAYWRSMVNGWGRRDRCFLSAAGLLW